MSGRASLGAPLALAAFAIVAAGYAASARSILHQTSGEDGDQILTVSEAETPRSATVTFICNAKRSQYGLVILAPDATWPAGGADVTLTAGGAVVGRTRFDAFENSLILAEDGEPTRGLLSAALRGDVLELAAGKPPIRLTLRDGQAQVERFRDLCGFK
ncbi:hypothetical protein [uncultured Enterovirga sp.]|uniref:hypothetical protein n=1 Tax=uncultured Enterovirga sp. TaxID=2026352 RepID=UPI0035CC21E9